MKVVWLPSALENRNTQLDYIAERNPKAAIEQGDQLARQVNQLREFPEIGRLGRTKDTRELVISRTSLIVVYRVHMQADRIELIRVLHGIQQWPPLAED